MEKEIRNIEIRTTSEENESRNVVGYALIFNSLSEDLGGFRELILPEAVDSIIENSDILALLNHSQERGILARSRYGKGSLTLEIDDKGLKYSFDAPRTALGDELLEYLKRGDITSSSFAFAVDTDKWDKQEDGTYIRTIIKFHRLYDVSPVFEPAYQSTSVCKRFLDIQEEEQRLLDEQIKKDNLKEYYNKLKEENKNYLNKE